MMKFYPVLALVIMLVGCGSTSNSDSDGEQPEQITEVNTYTVLSETKIEDPIDTIHRKYNMKIDDNKQVGFIEVFLEDTKPEEQWFYNDEAVYSKTKDEEWTKEEGMSTDRVKELFIADYNEAVHMLEYVEGKSEIQQGDQQEVVYQASGEEASRFLEEFKMMAEEFEAGELEATFQINEQGVIENFNVSFVEVYSNDREVKLSYDFNYDNINEHLNIEIPDGLPE